MLIDIIIPIYNAYYAVEKCLESVERHQQQAHTITLINDASSDNRILPLLENFSNRNNWHVINQSKNLGFVKTANNGLKLSKNHTLLLNSDTVVSKHWLQAFMQCLKENSSVGTITPWSNNAEICSFPKYLTNNPAIKNLDEFTSLLFKKHKPVYPNLPTAVGFCMLISQQAKQQVGYFDEEHFGHGYGEENDYSLRVTAHNLTNLLCDNAYILHIGNQSFTDLGLQPNEQTMQRLLQKHPQYLKQIQDYINLNPLEELRCSIKKLLKSNHL